jgi:hypothetical protein
VSIRPTTVVYDRRLSIAALKGFLTLMSTGALAI